METKHFNAKHDDATWRALFRRWHAGETSRALRAEAGVSTDTWQANAKRLGMRIRDLAPDDPQRRRVPAFAERTGDYLHPKSVLNERDWLRVMALRQAGVRGNLLAEVFGVAPASLCSQAKARGLPPPHLAREGRPEMAFVFDPHDPEKTALSMGGAILRAIRDERYDDAERLDRCWKQAERYYRRVGLTESRARPAAAPGRGRGPMVPK